MIVGWTICGIVGSLIWQRKEGSPVAGFLIGFIFGVFGIAFIVMATPAHVGTNQRRCPYCRELMRVDASVCPHCHRDVEPIARRSQSLIGDVVRGDAIGLPLPWSTVRVEASNDRLWWRPLTTATWLRAPYVDRYDNGWDGTQWLRGKRPEREWWQGPSPAEPAAR